MQLFSEEMRRNPYPVYERMRIESPVLHVPAADLWMVFDYAGVKRALSDTEAFSSNVSPAKGGSFEWLLFLDPPRHTKLRAIVSRAFTPASVANLEPRIHQISCKLLDAVTGQGHMDLAEDFAVPLPMMIVAEMIGIPSADWRRLRQWSDAIMNLADTITGGAEASAQAAIGFGAANREMQEYLHELTAERRVCPADDLLTRLTAAEVDGERLEEEEILRFVQLLLAAGTETTTNLINNAILCLVEHPEEMLRLRKSPELLPAAIEEVLRYRSPGQAMFRVTRRDVELQGQAIPAGRFVLAMVGSANRDPEQFADADRFDISRQPNAHIAFGHGIHFCLGAPLSRLEARVGLTVLLGRAHDIELVSDRPWEPRKAFHVHGPKSLPIRFSR
ncbi:MAG TPA: cytochrome P450 [Bryobacteraceae bacterium]|nr:cytochrome P450 [Bryobacteraceae bacterium]